MDDIKNLEHLPSDIRDRSADEIIEFLEGRGLGWDVGHTGRLRECRVWRWPHVIGRYRPPHYLPLKEMLLGAIFSGPGYRED